ncbi:MAG: electron transport complex subunit RsxG [Gammaproteobacteria bacterium]|nr:electron transport complex subunit RsxG [Gammaproteobacteria bacterium]
MNQSVALPVREQPYYQAFLLGLFALFVCGAVAAFSAVTKESIIARSIEDTQRQLVQVLPESLYDNMPSQEEITLTLDGKPVHFFRARKGGAGSGVALFAETSGYSGVIRILLGIDANGSLTGVRVLSHTETPGLGDAIDLNKSQWVLSFNGKSLQQPDEKGWHVKKDGGQFDSFTGATITPRAVVKGVHEALQLFQRHQNEFLDRKGS